MDSEEFQDTELSHNSLRVPGLVWESVEDITNSEWRADDDRVADRLNVLPKHGFCLWPEDGEDWIHPNDLDVARTLIPSKRIFRKVTCPDPILMELGYVVYSYGDQSFRGKQTLWHEVVSDGYEIGDSVELKSGYGKLRPIIADISEMFWNRHEQVIEYKLMKHGVPQPNRYQSSQFRLCMKIGIPPTPRQKALLNRENSLNGL